MSAKVTRLGEEIGTTGTGDIKLIETVRGYQTTLASDTYSTDTTASLKVSVGPVTNEDPNEDNELAMAHSSTEFVLHKWLRQTLLAGSLVLIALWALSYPLVQSSGEYLPRFGPEEILIAHIGSGSSLLLRPGAIGYEYTLWISDPITGAPKPIFGATFDLPLAFIAVLFAAYPMYYYIIRWVRIRHRRKHGLCLACGYPLCYLPSNVCPECGTPFHI